MFNCDQIELKDQLHIRAIFTVKKETRAPSAWGVTVEANGIYQQSFTKSISVNHIYTSSLYYRTQSAIFSESHYENCNSSELYLIIFFLLHVKYPPAQLQGAAL